jgi:hypothetical protein
MTQIYSFTLLDEMLEPIEDFIIEDSNDIEGAIKQAVAYMKEHQMPFTTLTFDDPVTFDSARDSIDIMFGEGDTIRTYDYATDKEDIL